MEYPTTTVDEKKNKDFFTAVIHGNFPEVERAVQEGASLDTSCDQCYVTALQIAVVKGHDDIVLWLAEQGASITLPNSRGFNAAHLAVEKKNLNVLNAFINQDNGCIARKVDTKYFEQTKESRHLVSHESSDCHEIIDGLFKIDVKPDWYGDLNFTLLDLAVNFEQFEMVKLLIRKGADASEVDLDGLSLLMVAANRGRTDVLKYLLDIPEVVSTINFQEKLNNYSALMFAVVNDHIEATKLLIAHGAEVTSRNKWGESVLHIAATMEACDLLQALFDAPNMSKMIDARDNSHYTPLMYVVQCSYLTSVDLLVSKGANVNVVDKNGWNLFHIASFEGGTEVLEHLLKNRHFKKVPYVGFERENHGLTPLHLAAYKGRIDCINVLIDQIGDYNKDSVTSKPWKKLNSGSTVVHAAVISGKDSILRKLYELKFNLNVKDNESMTPLLLAIKINNFEFVSQLLVYGASLADRMPGNTGLYEDKTALQIIINYHPQPETILKEVLNSVHYISSEKYNIPPTEASVEFGNLIPNTYNQDKSIEGERDNFEYNKFDVVKHLLDCREYKTKEEIILHPVVESLWFLFYKRLRPIYYFLLLVHFTCTVTFSIMVSPHLQLEPTTWYICMAVVITWLFLINLQELLFRNTSSGVNILWKITFQRIFKTLTTLLCLASLYLGHEYYCFVDLTPFALICVWFHLLCRMSLWYFPGVYLNIFLTVLWKMARVLFTFWTVIVGFALALQRVFPELDPFQDIFLALTRTLIMTQDLAYADLITERPSNMAVSVLVVFTLVVSIALANFLTGLAITDVEFLEKHGRVEWLLTRLKFLVDLEATMGSSAWRDCYLTRVIYSYLFKIENFEIYFSTQDFYKNKLPSKIVNSVFSTILKRKT